MLKKLFVQNYGIIEKTSVDFSDSLTIITGETGAGKSMLLGALSLILGNRASSNILFNKKKKCIVEGVFNLENKSIQSFFEENDLDYDTETIVRREITSSGKSRAFINDTPVNLTILSQLSNRVINLHGQHQSLYLNDKSYQLFILDNLAGHLDKVQKVKKQFYKYQEKLNKLNDVKFKAGQLKKELDYITFQANELEEANLLDENEQDQLETELNELSNSEEIQTTLLEMSELFSNADSPVQNSLQLLKKSLSRIANYGEKYQNLNKRLESLILEMNDISSEASSYADGVESNPAKAQELKERLDLILRLQNKHQVDSVEGLILLKDELVEKRDSVMFQEDEIGHLEKECEKLKGQALRLAKKISTKRHKTVNILSKKINQQLFDLGMEHASLEVQIESNPDDLTKSGIDQVQFLFASNKGSSAVEIKKVASGGELSRLMLAIQSLLADSSQLPSLIFDEIDTGISGEIAIKVGKAMKKLAVDHQLICITHLPQIACIGDKHLRIFKTDEGKHAVSQIEEIDGEERIIEIGTILSGEPPSKKAKDNARELLAFMND